MTPLVSVIFLLIIFFLVAGTVSSPGLWEIEHPHSSSDATVDQMDLSIFIDQDGNMAVGDREIKNNYQLRYLIDNAYQNRIPPSIEVHADSRVDSHDVIELLEQVRRGGVRKVDLVTEVAP
ncbi:MAG: biopolymer transporter ExbD [Gammaproteobacteria bacterium]|uniref:Biopolymer transporter ExbD n=1 Tax=Candidatus Thiopontia autotrophica TaxID=2841688 RepID=A0A8J6PF53_9GAMM|nr:biopolymer transporter ExbD [Candidatus Thiopontia autotrophica]